MRKCDILILFAMYEKECDILILFATLSSLDLPVWVFTQGKMTEDGFTWCGLVRITVAIMCFQTGGVLFVCLLFFSFVFVLFVCLFVFFGGERQGVFFLLLLLLTFFCLLHLVSISFRS